MHHHSLRSNCIGNGRHSQLEDRASSIPKSFLVLSYDDHLSTIFFLRKTPDGFGAVKRIMDHKASCETVSS